MESVLIWHKACRLENEKQVFSDFFFLKLNVVVRSPLR